MLTTDPEVATLIQRTRLLWSVLLAGQLVIALVALSGIVAFDAEPENPLLLPLFGLIALSTAAASLILWRHARKPIVGFHTSPTVEDLQSALPKYVAAWASNESIALLGLVLVFVGYSLATWAVFAGAALVLMLIQRP